MRKLFTFILATLLTVSVFAQSPEKMSYQAVIRDASDNLATSQSVGMQISILQGSTSGTAVYVERHFPTTNINGLVSIEIGTGTLVSGDFATIDWGNDIYFIKSEIDLTGGATYTISNTTQLLSVPYALFAKTAENVSGGVTETDPVYMSEPASGITSSNITNWDNKLDTEVDGDVSNELQNLSITGNDLSISSGNTVTLPNKIIRGTINGGFAPSIVSGSGFTVAHTSTGTYTVTFSTPFSTTPSAVVSLFNTQFVDCGAVVSSISTTNMVIKTGYGNENSTYTLLDNLNFTIIVVE